MRLFSFKRNRLFAREFPVIGTMSTYATNERKCQHWTKIMPFLHWKETRFVFQSDMTSPADADMMIQQYSMAKENENQILDAIKEHPECKRLISKGIDPFANENQVWVAAHLQEHDIAPCLEVFYNTHDYFIWFAIQDGKLSEFLPMVLVN